jgi:hypothetical protein
MWSSEGLWESPLANTSTTISAEVASSMGISEVNLFYSYSINGIFEKAPMSLGILGDVYAAMIPAVEAGTFVRFYIEAISANTVGTRVYEPAGAEHDTYYYTVDPVEVEFPSVVINELMAKNSTTASDESGQFEDWIELYNMSDVEMADLSGWHLSDNPWNLDKWTFPEGSIIPAGGYLIVWADEDGSDGPLHANFKLSGSGESVILTTADLAIVDQTTFSSQYDNLTYARVPNGIGSFTIQDPTFAFNNDHVGISIASENLGEILVYPNPVTSTLNLHIPSLKESYTFKLLSASGNLVLDGDVKNELTTFDVSSLPNGLYFLLISSSNSIETTRVVIQN